MNELASVKSACVVIPAYDPCDALTTLVHALLDANPLKGVALRILVIDDGSRDLNAVKIFSSIRELPTVQVFRHEENQGKGAALKSAIRIARDLNQDFIVTADADGQHAPQDVLSILAHGIAIDDFVIGTRQFDGKVPLRSLVGNRLTAGLFKLFTWQSVGDTQSGLRTIPKRFFDSLLKIENNRYDFELAALVHIAKQGPICQKAISTIYEHGNPTSHFKPFLDSARVYSVFTVYFVVGLFITAFDYLTFNFLFVGLMPAGSAFVITRLTSSGLYFFAMKYLVFGQNSDIFRQSLLFAALIGLNLLINTLFVTVLVDYWGANRQAAYFFCFVVMFFINFYFQKFVVFKPVEETP